MDASNYTGAFTDQQMQGLVDSGVQGVIVQAITGLNGISYTSQQCQMVAQYGLTLHGYVWCFPGESATSIDGRLAMFNGKPVRRLWADVEQAGLSMRDVDLLLRRCDLYLPTQRTGVYSGRWFFAQQGWLGVDRWSDRDLWDANYVDGVPDPTVGFVPYGGWDHCAIKQYKGTSDVGTLHEVDLDAVSPSVA